jgi:hypothetical protein
MRQDVPAQALIPLPYEQLQTHANSSCNGLSGLTFLKIQHEDAVILRHALLAMSGCSAAAAYC